MVINSLKEVESEGVLFGPFIGMPTEMHVVSLTASALRLTEKRVLVELIHHSDDLFIIYLSFYDNSLLQ
jgi:hypothetical protein